MIRVTIRVFKFLALAMRTAQVLPNFIVLRAPSTAFPSFLPSVTLRQDIEGNKQASAREASIAFRYLAVTPDWQGTMG
jgi:hypothetical protein